MQLLANICPEEFRRRDRVTICPQTAEVRVHVRSNGVSQGRWFQGADICERCKRTRIDEPRHGPKADPGYHHGDERWCEGCYYEKPLDQIIQALDRN